MELIGTSVLAIQLWSVVYVVRFSIVNMSQSSITITLQVQCCTTSCPRSAGRSLQSGGTVPNGLSWPLFSFWRWQFPAGFRETSHRGCGPFWRSGMLLRWKRLNRTDVCCNSLHISLLGSPHVQCFCYVHAEQDSLDRAPSCVETSHCYGCHRKCCSELLDK